MPNSANLFVDVNRREQEVFFKLSIALDQEPILIHSMTIIYFKASRTLLT